MIDINIIVNYIKNKKRVTWSEILSNFSIKYDNIERLEKELYINKNLYHNYYDDNFFFIDNDEFFLVKMFLIHDRKTILMISQKTDAVQKFFLNINEYDNFQNNLDQALAIVRKNDNNLKILEVIDSKKRKNIKKIYSKNGKYSGFINNSYIEDIKLNKNLSNGVFYIGVKNIIKKENNVDIKISKIVGRANDIFINERLSYFQFDESNYKNYNYGVDDFFLNIISKKDNKDSIIYEEFKKDFYTIDSSSTTDIDDAISIEKIDNKYILYVAISDVGYYLENDKEILNNARNKGQTIYLGRTIFPMIPSKYSSNLCSLVKNKLRNVVMCKFEFDAHGKIINYHAGLKRIKVKDNLSYEQVNNILENKKQSDKLNKLERMLFLFKNLYDETQNKDFLNINILKPDIKISQSNRIVSVKIDEHTLSEKIISCFMVWTNEYVSNLFSKEIKFGIYRNNLSPSEGHKDKIILYLKENNLYSKKFDNLTFYEVMLELLAGEEMKKIKLNLTDKLLKILNKATYNFIPIDHFSMNKKIYCHFTSPIRRFSDLQLNLYLRKYLINKNYYSNMSYTQLFKITDYNRKLCNNLTYISMTAKISELMYLKSRECEYISNHKNDHFSSTICSISDKKIYIKLNNGISGFIYNDNYADSSIKCEIGEVINVKLLKINKYKNSIEFINI